MPAKCLRELHTQLVTVPVLSKTAVGLLMVAMGKWSSRRSYLISIIMKKGRLLVKVNVVPYSQTSSHKDFFGLYACTETGRIYPLAILSMSTRGRLQWPHRACYLTSQQVTLCACLSHLSPLLKLITEPAGPRCLPKLVCCLPVSFSWIQRHPSLAHFLSNNISAPYPGPRLFLLCLFYLPSIKTI